MKKIDYIILSSLTFIILTGQIILKPTLFETDFQGNILIIDAGHGGLDGGAVSPNGISEADITLEISKKASEICSFLGIAHTLTRNTNESLNFDEKATIRENKVYDTKARTNLVNSFDNGFLASIHLNNFTDNKPSGAQIFYNEDAEVMANLLQENLNNLLQPNTKRVSQIYPSTVYLMKNSVNPAIIYECGFLSNSQDEKNLQNSQHQTKLALLLVGTYNNYLKGIYNETENNIYLQ